MLHGRFFVNTEDIKAVAHPVLRHRIITNFNAESAGVISDTVISRLLEEIPDRSDEDQVVPQLARAFAG